MRSGISGVSKPICDQQRDGIWQRLRQRSPQDVPVGIFGYGEIGQRVAADLAQLGFPVLVWSRSAKPTPCPIRGFHGPSGLSAMADETEVLVNLLPLTPETQGILNGELFARMRRGGYLDPGRARRAPCRRGSAGCAGKRPTRRCRARCVRSRAAGAGTSVLASSQDRRHTPRRLRSPRRGRRDHAGCNRRRDTNRPAPTARDRPRTRLLKTGASAKFKTRRHCRPCGNRIPRSANPSPGRAR